jgi:hypothetical protein
VSPPAGWKGGIPHRTTSCATLSPLGGGKDDTSQINDALAACPSGQVVQLAAGTFNVNGNGISFATSGVTLRGSGTGTPGSGAGGTRLIKADRLSNPNYAVLYMGNGFDTTNNVDTATNLASDAAQGSYSVILTGNPGIQVGQFVLIDHNTDNDSRVDWGPNHDPPGGGSRRWFARQDRSLVQLMEVSGVNGNTISFTTPIHIAHPVSYSAQLVTMNQAMTTWSGVEDVYIYGGMGGDGHGNLSISTCAYCWAKNVEAHWSVGTNVGLYTTFRSEVRDSYIHETPDPNPGGGGYQTGINTGAADNLVENNVIWYGNKVVVMRASGGGNVFAYNYTDDAFGSGYPSLGEAGINAGHYTTPHMELLEGNYSENFKGDSFWGSSIYITVFRNQLTSLRAGHQPLSTYTNNGYSYGDASGRNAVSMQAFSYWHNMVGNVLGTPGQMLLPAEPNTPAETAFAYQNVSHDQFGYPDDTVAVMWGLGEGQQDPNMTQYPGGYSPYDPKVEGTCQRDGNWDFVTSSQIWHGIGGAAGSGAPKALPSSLYIPTSMQPPSWWGANPWPWLDPATGAVHTLPAKARFEAIPLANFPTTVSFQ